MYKHARLPLLVGIILLPGMFSVGQAWAQCTPATTPVIVQVFEDGVELKEGSVEVWLVRPGTEEYQHPAYWDPIYDGFHCHNLYVGTWEAKARKIGTSTWHYCWEPIDVYEDFVEVYAEIYLPPSPCTDNDNDGYGHPASTACPYPEFDCDDSDRDVNPGMIEGPLWDPTCSDGKDNDCDDSTDGDDHACQCTDDDYDGFAIDGGECGEIDCEDSNRRIFPGNQNEFCDCQDPIPQGTTEHRLASNCTDGQDNDCDGLVDDIDQDCPYVPCAGTAEASTYQMNQVHRHSDLGKHLAFFTLPLGVVIGLLLIRRRKR